jgi:transposase-like protein
VYPLSKKEKVIAAYKISKNATQVAKDHNVNKKTVFSWLSEYQLNNKFLPRKKTKS